MTIVREVLRDLPEWFGLEDGIENYVIESKNLALWYAKDSKNTSIGFITLKESSVDCGEIHCMGIKKDYHRLGIGRKLVDELEKNAKKNYDYLQVKTVDEGYYSEYDSTVKFYKKLGFKKLEVLPELWGESNPCLIMIKKLL